MKNSNHTLVQQYLSHKHNLSLLKRYYDIFECRHGITDNKFRTLDETGKIFGISGNRVRQIEARVKYELEKVLKI